MIYAGATHGKWTVVTVGSQRSLCRCACGREVWVLNCNWGRKSTQCRPCASTGKKNSRKWCKDLPSSVYRRLRTIVGNAVTRCTDANHPQWKDWGGRGITVCQEWLDDPQLFIRYLTTLACYLNPELVLDRKDNDGHYEPGNLRFVNRSVSSLNRRPFSHLLARSRSGRFVQKSRSKTALNAERGVLSSSISS